MKKIISVLLCSALLLCLVACDNGADTDTSSKASSISDKTSIESASSSLVVPTDNNYEETTSLLTQITEYFHITGRTAPAVSTLETGEQTGFLYDHAAQGFLFNADCEGDVTLSLSINAKGSSTKRFFTVYIDGVKQEPVVADVIPTADMIVKLKVASGLSKGKHLIEVFRNQENYYGDMTLLSVTMNGVPEKWVEDEDQIKIEVIGDSITCGNGITAVNGAADEDDVNHTNSVLAYPFVAARVLGAEISVVGRSGLTNANKAGTSKEPYYNGLSVIRYGNEHPYDHSKMDVDLYIVALGTNDYHAKFTNEQIIQDAVNTMTTVRKDHPNAKILWVIPPKRNDDLYSSAVEQVGGAEKGFYFYCFETYNNKGGTYHPTAEAQQKMGEGLAAYIKTIME